jgi:hypothetical protein
MLFNEPFRDYQRMVNDGKYMDEKLARRGS